MPRAASQGIGSTRVPYIPLLHLEVQVRTCGEAAVADRRDVLPGGHPLPLSHEDLVHVAVDRHVTVVVPDVDGQPEPTGFTRTHDGPVAGGVDRRADGRGEVDAVVERAPACLEKARQRAVGRQCPVAGHRAGCARSTGDTGVSRCNPRLCLQFSELGLLCRELALRFLFRRGRSGFGGRGLLRGLVGGLLGAGLSGLRRGETVQRRGLMNAQMIESDELVDQVLRAGRVEQRKLRHR
ncbi:hypothetical protein CLV47_108144 [Antricoccus suffuscus]|uniref:Uncharacterized protein n=1 Tax=Antricoccus suffuscus TaxID=1629062 RepID=A0A2T0ZZK4_9ACTN|nr:hypothetical protein CLV47_108144 [Antricoccus suffuscus]